MSASYTYANAQRLLIKPFERLEFILTFVLASGLGQILAFFLFVLPASDSLGERPIQYGIATRVVTGMFIGASQWLVLRRYISDWKWILAVAVNSRFMVSIIKMVSTLHYADELSGQKIFLIVLVEAIFLIGLPFISGYLQWRVLRPYVVNARWWIFIPFVAVLATSILILLETLTNYLLPIEFGIINLTILSATQAIGLCILNKKATSEHNIDKSLLALAPDIVNYWKIKKLEKILRNSISKVGKIDLKASVGKLTYFVGINSNNSAIAYEAVNQVSKDNVDLTPLPTIATNTYTARDAEGLTYFAKFQVVFTPPGLVKVYSWRGIPLKWLGLSFYAAIIAISFLAAWLGLPLWFLILV